MNTLEKKIIIKGKIKLQSGLHIGGSNSGMEIGGLNAEVVRNPIDNKPYIPGSSLKGKLRALLEIMSGNIGGKNGNIVHSACDDPSKCDNPSMNEALLFGYARNNKGSQIKTEDRNFEQQPSRIIVRDCYLLSKKELFKNTDLYFTQSKTEVAIDRITAIANPRTMERIPQGAVFSMEMVLNVFETESEEGLDKEFLAMLFQAMTLLEDDYLGGKGSRGSGQIDFIIESIVERGVEYYKQPVVANEKNILSECNVPARLSSFTYTSPA